jgi:hypothetical protein
MQNSGIIQPAREITVSVSKISQEVETKISNSEIDVNLSSVAGHELGSTLTGAHIGFSSPGKMIVPIDWGSISITH